MSRTTINLGKPLAYSRAGAPADKKRPARHEPDSGRRVAVVVGSMTKAIWRPS